MDILVKANKCCVTAFKSFYNMFHTQFDTKLWILRSDNVGEYLSNSLSSFFDAFGIVHHTICLGTLEQNGVVERKNRHLLEIVGVLMFRRNVPKSFWSDAI